MGIMKERVRVNQIGKTITSQFIVEDDYNVPDNRADIGRIVTCDGTLKIEEVKPVENYLKINGKLLFKVLYVTDSGVPNLASMEGKLPIEEMVYVEDGATGEYQIRVCRVDLQASLIHSRKMEIRAVAELALHWEKMEEEEAAVGVESEYPVYQKMRQAEILQLYDSKRDIYRLKEEITLPGTKENIDHLIWTEVALRKLDTKLGDDMLLLNGEVQVFCIYQSQEEKTDWVEQTVPFEGQIACQGADSRYYHHIYRTLQDENVEVRLDEDGEMRVLGIEAVLEMRVLIYKEEKMDLLEDVYSLEMKCETTGKRVFFEELIMQNHSKHKITEKLLIPEIREEILQICHTGGEIQIEKMEAVEEGIRMEGILHASFLYVKANDKIPFDVWSGMIPFTYLMECENAGIDVKHDITYGLEQLAIELTGSGEVEVKAHLAFQSFLRRPLHMEMISDIAFTPFEEKEKDKKPGIVVYLVKKNDDLWKLAKRYGTTEDSIMEINELSSKALKEGEKILILKENMSIL